MAGQQRLGKVSRVGHRVGSSIGDMASGPSYPERSGPGFAPDLASGGGVLTAACGEIGTGGISRVSQGCRPATGRNATSRWTGRECQSRCACRRGRCLRNAGRRASCRRRARHACRCVMRLRSVGRWNRPRRQDRWPYRRAIRLRSDSRLASRARRGRGDGRRASRRRMSRRCHSCGAGRQRRPRPGGFADRARLARQHSRLVRRIACLGGGALRTVGLRRRPVGRGAIGGPTVHPKAAGSAP